MSHLDRKGGEIDLKSLLRSTESHRASLDANAAFVCQGPQKRSESAPKRRKMLQLFNIDHLEETSTLSMVSHLADKIYNADLDTSLRPFNLRWDSTDLKFQIGRAARVRGACCVQNGGGLHPGARQAAPLRPKGVSNRGGISWCGIGEKSGEGTRTRRVVDSLLRSSDAGTEAGATNRACCGLRGAGYRGGRV